MYLGISLTFDNWLSLLSVLFISIGGCFALYQWRSSIKTKRAEFINQILEKLRFDRELADTMYIVDYDQNWYSREFHGSNELEGAIDKLFSYLDYICYLKDTKNITKTEFNIFRYEIHRVCISISTQSYLWNLYHFSKKNKSACSFQYLINYGINSKLFPKDFKENITLHNKTLNW